MAEIKPLKYFIVDSKGIVVAHSGAIGESYSGSQFDSIIGLPQECQIALRELLNESTASERAAGHTRRMVQTNNEMIEISLVEVIRVERAGCNLKQALNEWLLLLARQLENAGISLVLKMCKEIPELVLVDADKFIWVSNSLIQNAIHSVPRGMFFGRGGGKVEVSVTYEKEEKLLSIVVEDDGGVRTEKCLEEASFHGPSGRMNGAGKFARSIVEAHGGSMTWEHFQCGPDKKGTRVSVTIPAI